MPAAGGTGGGQGEPGEEVDRLFRADYVHVGDSSGDSFDGANCDATCAKCKESMLVQRPHRKLEGPAVHYGVIASGDLDIECGVTRDRATKALGAICFEREAAGLVNNFPCLVIRGICDYADSHRSNRWQGYAAASAAAFAKELLGHVSVQEVLKMNRILEVMKDGELFLRI